MRCGTKLYNGIEIPANCQRRYTPLNRPCYISAIAETTCVIKFLDGDMEYKAMGLDKMKMLKLMVEEK